jgi:probable HAF family extracellular repeat protein
VATLKWRTIWGLALALLVLSLACDHVPLAPASAAGSAPRSAANVPPRAALRVAWSGTEGSMSAGFTAAGSLDPNGDTLYYTWDFGDGTTITTTYVAQRHGYLDDGSYTVRLTVTDIHGAQATATAPVSIRNVTPVIRTARLEIASAPSPIPVAATIHLEIYDPGVLDNPVPTVDWGDGTVSNDTTHVYREPGIFVPKVTVTDKDGATASRSIYTAVWTYDPIANRDVPEYEVIDLGTLGGDRTLPRALNNHGEVVGSSSTATRTEHAFLWRNGALTDLTPAGQYSGASAINDAGWIAGRAADERYDEESEVALWQNGIFVGFVSTPAEEFGPSPVKIGETGNVLVNVHGHEWPHAFFVRNGQAIQLSTPFSWANDMNAREQVVGAVTTKSSGALGYEYHAFLWDDGVMKDLGVIGTNPCVNIPEEQCGWSEASDINERGQIVGFSTSQGGSRAVVWDPDNLTPRDLGFGTAPSRATAVNDNGQIAGHSYESGEAFFLDGDQVVTLGSLGGGWTRVAGMNEGGTVAGTTVTASGEVHAFVWSRATGMRDLGSGPFGAPQVGSVAVAINDRGDVLGYAQPCPTNYRGYCYGGPIRAVLWRRLAPQTAGRR